MDMQIMQGDAYNIAFTITDSEGSAITDEGISEVEITVGDVTKTYSSGDVTYSDGEWFFPLTQEETFAMSGYVRSQIRVKAENEVVGEYTGRFQVIYSQSKESL